MDDKIEAWVQRAMVLSRHCQDAWGRIDFGEQDNDEAERAELEAHLRTTPEGFVMAKAEPVAWTPIESGLPESGHTVLLTIENERGKRQVIRAQYAAKYTLEQSPECDGGDYDEKTDTYWCEEGWYEWNDSEEIHWRVSDTAIAWALLPQPYASQESGT